MVLYNIILLLYMLKYATVNLQRNGFPNSTSIILTGNDALVLTMLVSQSVIIIDKIDFDDRNNFCLKS